MSRLSRLIVIAQACLWSKLGHTSGMFSPTGILSAEETKKVGDRYHLLSCNSDSSHTHNWVWNNEGQGENGKRSRVGEREKEGGDWIDVIIIATCWVGYWEKCLKYVSHVGFVVIVHACLWSRVGHTSGMFSPADILYAEETKRRSGRGWPLSCNSALVRRKDKKDGIESVWCDNWTNCGVRR